MPPEAPIREKVRTAEVIAALSLATDLGAELPLEHGLHSTLFAIRLCERLGVDTETAFQAYYGCLLFHVGCTTDADIAAELFDEGMLREHWAPVMFGSQAQTMLGIMRALAQAGTPGRRCAPSKQSADCRRRCGRTTDTSTPCVRLRRC
jgi:hypothetical protein